MAEGTQVCQRCGKLFHYPGFGNRYCKACLSIDTGDFDKVKKYIYENGTATMMEIVVATGVKEQYVKQYLREGRLEIPENSPVFIKCEICGCDIKSGRVCQQCAASMSKGLKSAYIEVGDKPKECKGKMRFLNKINKK